MAAGLKKAVRHCWIEGERRESVAKVLRMCLIHDLGEAFTGDIPAFDKTEADTAVEDTAFLAWIESFPQRDRLAWQALLQEMDELTSKEAQAYKVLDKLEAVISHNESDITTWLELEYELQQSYGQEYMSFSPYFVKLRALVDQWTRNKIAASEQS